MDRRLFTRLCLSLGLMVAASALFVSTAEADPGPERPFDHGVLIEIQPPERVGAGRRVFEYVPFFTDCEPGETPPQCGPPAGKWVGTKPVEFCSLQSHRPVWIGAEQFRAAIVDAAAVWNQLEAAIGVRYVGDCAVGERWEPRNGRNEIAFDDERSTVSGATAALTRALTSWTPAHEPTVRTFLEADIILDDVIGTSGRCFLTLMIHELGHALGFGHSDNRDDLMYPTFNPSDPTSCKSGPSAEERNLLQQLYGVDRAPTVRADPDQTVDPGVTLLVGASGADPEGAPLEYRWTQIAGPPVVFTTTGRELTFFVGESVGVTYRFRVTVTDPMLHAASAVTTVTVSRSTEPPRGQIAFESFLPGAARRDAHVGWSGAEGATLYELCTATDARGLDAGACFASSESALRVDWDEVINAIGSAEQTFGFTSGWRHTQVRACNTIGCAPAVLGPIAGGLRWANWGIDFDYFAMAYDVGGLQFTIAGVVNLSDTARAFIFSNGPAEHPQQRVFHRCPFVAKGGVCIGLMTPTDGRQASIATIVSTRGDGPTTIHAIPVR